MSTIQTHDDYIAQTKEQFRESLKTLRSQVAQIIPDAEEKIAYNMPGFMIGEAIVLGYAAFSKQCGIYVSNGAIDSLQKELQAAGFEPTKTGVKFTPSKPIPKELLKKLVLASRKDLEL